MDKISIESADNSSSGKDENSSKEKKEVCMVECDDQPWNYKILLLLKKIGKKTMGYRWMHEQEAIYYDDRDIKFGIAQMIIITILGFISGTGLINAISGTGLENNVVFITVVNILNLIGLVVLAIVTKYPEINKYSDMKNSHANAANRYAELNLAIQSQLSLNLKDRESDKMFLQSVIRIFNSILFLSPPIREKTKKKYIEGSEDNDIFNPLISEGDGLQIIVRNGNEQDNKDIDSTLKYQIDRWIQYL